MLRNSRPAPEAMPTRSRAAKSKVTSADIWTRKSCRCGQAACGHVLQDIICAMEEKDIWTSPCVRCRPSVRHQGQAHPEAGHQASGSIPPCRCRSRFMQHAHPTSAPTGHHAAPDIRDISPRLPRERVLVHAAAPMETRTRSRGCRFRCRQDMEELPPSGQALPCRFMQHAPAPDMEELPTSGRTSGCAIWTRSRPALAALPMLQLH